MLYLRSWLLMALCVSVTFVQSEKLPKKLSSSIQLWEQSHDHQTKIKSGHLSTISYNTWGLPVSLYGHEQSKRFELIGESLASLHTDIICVQETFHPRLREKLLEDLTRDYYTFSDYRCNRPILSLVDMDCTGGLMTFSVFPIVEETFYPFPSSPTSSIIEDIGHKGFLLSTIQHGNEIITVINTHLYAGDNANAEKHRYEQVKYIKSILSQEKYLQSNGILMMGDFNIHHPNVACSQVYDFIINEMGFADSKPQIDESDYTYSNSNKYITAHKNNSKLDYVFMKSKANAGLEVISQSRSMDSNEPLSDHFGWSVALRLKS